MIHRETYMQKIRPFINKDLVKILTGIRRCGKSVMLELIKEELFLQNVTSSQMISINFEDLDNQALCSADALHRYVADRIGNSVGKTFLFFDEIQEVENWEKCINSFRVKFNVDIYITGSNAKLLSGEFATYLAGRYVEFVIYPFSFLEFMEMYSSIHKVINAADGFKQYILLGGMPFLANLNYQAEPCNQYLQDVYNSVILKDVISRNNIRDVDLLERIIIYLLANIGKTFSATSISRYFKSENRNVSPETILNYIKACENAFLFYRVERQEVVGKKILNINEKFYVADHGIRQAVYGNNNRDIEIILENTVYMELLRRGYSITVGKIDSVEVDFVAKKQESVLYIQVAYLLASDDTINREFGALQKIDDNYPKYVVTMDEFDRSRDGIRHLNIKDFLMNLQI